MSFVHLRSGQKGLPSPPLKGLASIFFPLILVKDLTLPPFELFIFTSPSKTPLLSVTTPLMLRENLFIVPPALVNEVTLFSPDIHKLCISPLAGSSLFSLLGWRFKFFSPPAH